VDFTREPIIETVITPKEGCKLVVRSSHTAGQEEFFVDAVQVVSFGHSFFFRSLERPKTFMVPASDYEIVEVREPRLVLKNVGVDRSIKIAGGREGSMRSAPREPSPEPTRAPRAEPEVEAQGGSDEARPAASADRQQDKRRDRRRNVRRRRGRDEPMEGESQEGEGNKPAGTPSESKGEGSLAQQVVTTSILHALLPPPPRLISETIEQYRDTYKDAFYSKDEPKPSESPSEAPVKSSVELNQPEYGSYEMTAEEEEAIYQLRKKQGFVEQHKEEHSHEQHAPESAPDAARFLSDMEENRPPQDS
jgi:hypothetical protein